MTSICNYSHPELQIMEGLVRQTSGTLFPYNPEFYKLASGLYGPGTLYCWYLLLVSVVINWLFQKKDDEVGVSNDLLAALAYPVFAATDALIHALRILGMEYRALAIFCLRMPKVELKGFGKFNDTQLDLRLPIPPNIVSLGQHAIDIGGPLPLCYTFITTVPPLAVCLVVLAGTGKPDFWILTKWARRLVYVTYGYVILALTIFHLSLGDIGISMIISMYEAILPFILFMLFALCILVPILTLGVVVMLVKGLRAGDNKRMVEGLKGLGGCLFVAALAGYMIFCVYDNGVPLIPDVAVSITERDQIAALIGGIVTLCFTLAHNFGSSEEEENEGEEI
jgi:hypothetical protein